MKKIIFTLSISLILSVLTFAQSEGINKGKGQLDHTRLLQKLSGIWSCDMGNNQTAAWNVKSFGTGIEATFKVFTGGELTTDGKQLWGYDEENDCIIGAGMFQNTGVQLVTMKFTSESEYVINFYKDAENPDHARFKVVGKIESPYRIIETTYDGENVVKVDTWRRAGL
jgi:hypothetical protein